jgi:hypothetical protein
VGRASFAEELLVTRRRAPVAAKRPPATKAIVDTVAWVVPLE